jgi:hypothetical protein
MNLHNRLPIEQGLMLKQAVYKLCMKTSLIAKPNLETEKILCALKKVISNKTRALSAQND